jgi:hypothetical protein
VLPFSLAQPHTPIVPAAKLAARLIYVQDHLAAPSIPLLVPCTLRSVFLSRPRTFAIKWYRPSLHLSTGWQEGQNACRRGYCEGFRGKSLGRKLRRTPRIRLNCRNFWIQSQPVKSLFDHVAEYYDWHMFTLSVYLVKSIPSTHIPY